MVAVCTTGGRAGSNVEVTGGGQKIALHDPAAYKLTRGKWHTLSYIDLTPAVVCRFEGNREGLFQLDTGYVGTVTFYDKFIRDEKLLEGRAVKEETSSGSGGAFQLLTGQIEWFELAGVRFKHPKAGFRVAGHSREGGAGVVGRDFRPSPSSSITLRAASRSSGIDSMSRRI